MKKIASITLLVIIVFSTLSVHGIGKIGQTKAETEPREDVLIISNTTLIRNYTSPAGREAYFGLYEASQMPPAGWDLLKNTIDWATKKKDPSVTKIVFFTWDGTVYSASSKADSDAVYSKLTSSAWGYKVANIALQGQSAAATLPSSYYDGYDLVIYWNTYGYDCSNIVNSAETPFITCSAMQTDEMGIGRSATTLHEFENTIYLVNRCWTLQCMPDSPTSGYPTDWLYLIPESNMWLDTAEAANFGMALATTEEPLIYVTSISMSVDTRYGQTSARVEAKVTISDPDGNSPIDSAGVPIVTGNWSYDPATKTPDLTNTAVGAITPLNSGGGVATLYSEWGDNPEGKFTFTIKQIEKKGRAYFPSKDDPTSNSMNVYIVNMVFVNGWEGQASDMANVQNTIGTKLAQLNYPNTFVQYNSLNNGYGDKHLDNWAAAILQDIQGWDAGGIIYRHKNLILVGHSFGGKAIIDAVQNPNGAVTNIYNYPINLLTSAVVTINSPIEKLIPNFLSFVWPADVSVAYLITMLGPLASWAAAASDVMNRDSTSDARNMVSSGIKWLAFTSGEAWPAEMGTDTGWSFPFSLSTLLFPYDMTDGFLPMQAEFVLGTWGSDTVYYGLYDHCALGSDPAADIISTNIVKYIFGETIYVSVPDDNTAGTQIYHIGWAWPYWHTYPYYEWPSSIIAERSFYLVNIVYWKFRAFGIPGWFVEIQDAGWTSLNSFNRIVAITPGLYGLGWGNDNWVKFGWQEYYKSPCAVTIFGDPPGPVPDPVNSTVTQVGVAGGTVSVESANLTIPPGALSGTANITVDVIKELWAWNGSLPEYGDVVGYVYRFGPEGLGFSEPVDLTISYNETAVTDENLLAVLMYNYTTGEWQRTGATIDTTAHTASLTIDHFSTFALAQMRDTDGDGIPDDIDNWPYVYNPDQVMTAPKDDLYINSNTILQPGTYHIADSGAEGVLIINASNIILDCNGASINGSGSGTCIYNPGFENVTILNCNAANYQCGIMLNASSYNAVMNNTVESNGCGIFVQSSNCGCILVNHIKSNAYGIYLSSSINNTIIDNYFNNTENAWDDGKNDWNMTYRPMWMNIVGGLNFGGNYWSDYTGMDLYSGPYQNETGSDGIGDTPYVINANNTDSYPLMNLLLPQYSNVTFDQTGVGSDFTGTVVTIDGTNYAASDLPVSFLWNSGSTHTFAFQSPLLVGSGAKEYDWTSTTGLLTLQSDSITVTGPGSITGNYLTRVHDVAVTSLVAVVPHYSSKAGNGSWVFQGMPVYVNVTVLNKGDFDENVNVTLYYNATADEMVGTQIVALSAGTNQTIAFNWNTKGVPYCLNYTITAVATIPLDNNPSDNTLSTGPITVRIMGDINGDGTVDGSDLIIVARAFGSYGPNYVYSGSPPSTRWNLDADINGDNTVDGSDLVLVARNFGK